LINFDIETNKEYAVKLESTKSKLPQLLYEIKLYKVLAGGVGIPNIHWYGIDDNYN
jgi:casein kinase 1